MRKLILSIFLIFTVGILIYITVLSKAYKPDLTKVSPDKVKSTNAFEQLFDHNNFRQFKIVINQEEWTGLSQDMIDYSRIDDRMRVDNYRRADIYYTDNYGEVIIKDVGIRTKGNTTRVIPENNGIMNQFHFKLKFDETFDEVKDTASYLNLNNRDFADLGELNFKYNNGSDSSFIHEIFCYELFNEVGVSAANASLASVIIVVDGEEYDYGVYTIIEPIDKQFLRKRYGKERDDGNLYKCLWQNFGPASLEPINRFRVAGIKNVKTNYRPAYDLKTNKNKENHQVLYDFSDNINKLKGNALKAYLDENFEVDMFLRTLAMGILFSNPDDYWAMGNNYYIYFNNDGKIAFIPSDYDHSFGSGWGGEPVTNHEGLVNADIYNYVSIDSGLSNQKVSKPLVEKILAIEDYKKTYEDYLAYFINPSNNYFSYSRFEHTFDQLQREYGDQISNDFTNATDMKINAERRYFDEKTKSVSTQLEEVKWDE